MPSRRLGITLLCTLIAAPACDRTLAGPDDTAPDAALAARRQPPPDVAQFNPQPEPPHTLYTNLDGPIDGVLTGRYRNDARTGAITVRTSSAVRRDGILRLSQTWSIQPPDPVVPPDPVHPSEGVRPVVVELRGSMDLASGALLLTGALADGSVVTVRATVSSGHGPASVAGEVMFNPQPDPPVAFH